MGEYLSDSFLAAFSKHLETSEEKMTFKKDSMWEATYQTEPSDLAINVKSYEDRIAALEVKLAAEREKVTILQDAAELALQIAESWIHDQLDGTSQLENSLSCLDPVRKALATTEPEDV